MANGIDVYVAYQTVRDWSAVKHAGYDFCYVKAGDGTSTRATNSYGPRGRAAGVAMGAYWYAQPGNAVQQANMLCDRAISEGLADLAPVLDLESPFVPGPAAAAFAVAFCRQVAARGFRPGLYANDSMLSSVLAAVRAAVPIVIVWVARYGRNPVNAYDVWQWNDKGSVPGVSASSVDLNRGVIPYNLAASPAANPSEDELACTNGVLKAGQNEHLTLPFAGIVDNAYLWIFAGYNDELTIHQMDFVKATPGGAGGAFVPDAGRADWKWDVNRPGPVDIRDQARKGAAGVVLRYSSNHDIAWQIG